MIQVCDNLFVGNGNDCFYDDRVDYAVIHACKSPCHQEKLGYTGNLSPNHPNYLILEDGNHLYLNIVDMKPILPEFADPIFFKAIKFIKAHISNKNVLIHCNLGLSRSPAIALVFMAKNSIITSTSYRDAIIEFKGVYPEYNPGEGIHNYLHQNWRKLTQ